MEKKIDELDPELRQLSLKIHDNPELMFEEKIAHDALTHFMSKHGFDVTPHYLGLETAWRASFKQGEGGPVLGVNSEMDALPGIGHACGHNLIAIAGVGIAVSVKAALEKHGIPGEVVLLGTPAEEGGGGKILLLERGGYSDMDICIMTHPGPGAVGEFNVPETLSIQTIDIEYFGKTAHASARPWEGVNALDAAVLAYSSISALRQQIKPDHRVHGIIEGKNWAANIIPDYATLHYIVRAPTGEETAVLYKRVEACFEAAAISTGCQVKVTPGILYAEVYQNEVMGQSVSDTVSLKDIPLTDLIAEEFIKISTGRYGLTFIPSAGPQASTDFGDISKALPGLHPGYAIPAKSANHTKDFTEAAGSEVGHKATLTHVKALSALGLKVLTDDAFLKAVKDSFQKWKSSQDSL
ncbi:hypothetical protein M422DRAFT_58526 [Sphaerobolus stellatus SS14]|nr:hypothetical protein M422DRAFT_58526 [Sphaerobolus stellatus SS14]